MRVLYKRNYNKIVRTIVSEIDDIGYDDDITNIKDYDGNYNAFDVRPVEGLYIVDTSENYYYFPNISQSTCEKICEEAFEKGYVDLRKYGPYMDDPDEEEE